MAAPSTVHHDVPPLEPGDRLARAEFHRLYSLHHEIRKAELVEGVVHVPSPLSTEHSRPHASMSGWLVYYAATRPGTEVHDNVTLRPDADNELQPDLCMYDPGRNAVREGKDHFLYGAPELVVEIAATSASYDLHDKLNVYRRNGVQEYIVWRVYDEAIDWFALREGEYKPLAADAAGIVHSEVFPGLKLDINAMLRGDIQAVLKIQTVTP